VMKISVREVANARFVREAIESDIARHAALLATPAQLDNLNALVAAQKEAAAAEDYRRFNDADEGFHRAIADIVENDYSWRIVEAARFQTDRVRLLSLPFASPMQRLISQHEDVVTALAARDGEAAAQAM